MYVTIRDVFLFLSHTLSHFDLCLFMSSHVLRLSPLDWCHYIDFQWPGESQVIKSQVTLMVLVSFYKAARRWWEQPFTPLALNLNPAHLKLDLLLLSFPYVLTLKPKVFTFSWARLCATGVAPVINIAAPVGSGSSKIVFLRPTPQHIKIYIMFS